MRLLTAVALCVLVGALCPSHAESAVPRTPARLARMILAADWPKVVTEAEAWAKVEASPAIPNSLINFANAQMATWSDCFESAPEMVQAEAEIEGSGDSFSVKVLLRARSSVEAPPAGDSLLLPWAREFARRHPESIPALALLANACIVGKDVRSALAVAEKAVAMAPDSALAACTHGCSQDAAKAPEVAIADYTRAIELDPSFPRPLALRGQIYYNQGRYDLAIADVTKLLELNPENVAAYAQRGQAYQGRGMLDEALQDFTKIVELQPKWGFGYLFRAVCHLTAEDYEAALKDCDQALALAPNWSAALLFHALISQNAGDTDGATKDLSAFIGASAQAGPVPWVLLAIALAEADRYEEAEKAFNQFIRLAPKAGLKDKIPAVRHALKMMRESEDED